MSGPARGLDVAPGNQRVDRMRYAEWASAGLGYGWVEYVRDGQVLMPQAAAHRAAMQAAGLLSAGYLNLGPGDGAAQMRQFLAVAPAGELPDMLDVEELRLFPDQVLAACQAHAASGRRLCLYTGYWSWLAIMPPEQRAFFKRYPLVIGSYPHDAPDNQPQPMDPESVARRSNPPLLFVPPVPEPWTLSDVLSWQYSGHGSLPGYSDFLDLHRAQVTLDELRARYGKAPMPITLTGCLLGGFTQGTSSITPIYRDLAAAGAVPAVGLADEDGGKVIEWAALGVPTRINRKHLPETGPDHDFELGGDFQYRKHWPADKLARYQTQAVNLPYRSSVAEFLATTHFQTLGNEWENQDVEGWLSDLDKYQGVLEQASQRSVHDKAMLMGISDELAATLPPVRYVLPVFNAGTPKTWAMYEAIAAHPIWPIAARRGDCLLAHEGIGFDEDFSRGEDTPVEPGAPRAPGAGTVNFRIYNLLWLLAARGIAIDWVVGEWYDGRRVKNNQIAERVANMIRHDLRLAASPFAARCRGYCQYLFTDDPTSRWFPQDCTHLWRDPRWRAHVISQIGRINGKGEDDMEIADKDVAALSAAAGTINAILARYPLPGTAHVWRPGDHARAVANPLQLYDGPQGAAHGQPRANYTAVIDVFEVSPDGAWLRVFNLPPLWVRAADVVLV